MVFEKNATYLMKIKVFNETALSESNTGYSCERKWTIVRTDGSSGNASRENRKDV